MGPRLCSRGNGRAEEGKGAEEVLQWGHDFAAVEIEADIHWARREVVRLQWGHDFAAVEIEKL